MEEEILRVIKNAEEKGWITLNKHLEPEAIAAVFVDELRKMPLDKFVKIFSPNW